MSQQRLARSTAIALAAAQLGPGSATEGPRRKKIFPVHFPNDFTPIPRHRPFVTRRAPERAVITMNRSEDEDGEAHREERGLCWSRSRCGLSCV